MDATYGVREDGSVWISLGNPKTGPHCQFDLMGEFEAKLICNAFARVKALEDVVEIAWDHRDMSHTYHCELVSRADKKSECICGTTKYLDALGSAIAKKEPNV